MVAAQGKTVHPAAVIHSSTACLSIRVAPPTLGGTAFLSVLRLITQEIQSFQQLAE
jgi:hypothetical protein